MYRDIALRPLAVAAALAVTAVGGAEARDEGYRGQYFRTYSAQAEQLEQRSGVRLQGRRHAVPDYRVVRGFFDGQSRYRVREDATTWRGDERMRRDGRAPPAVIVGSGRFSGNANAWYRSGAGSYFTITSYDENSSYGAFERYAPPDNSVARSGVMTVDRGAIRRNDSACSFEAGVCVIRGR
ncbi:hypothetical protein [Rhizobium sp. Leaf341]|uniref:hypothetical protein n=1 Tax=Rhizobium sp. Leaf341 TaxID=1736344 RepID=UPI0007158DA6|nr:hypothetical protein [Rhizobium sp. Leaf341]KQR79152.1 hypothetical protein ASG03_11280 [Rhizobium sp. Leaf341]